MRLGTPGRDVRCVDEQSDNHPGGLNYSVAARAIRLKILGGCGNERNITLRALACCHMDRLGIRSTILANLNTGKLGRLLSLVNPVDLVSPTAPHRACS